jgi:hypothetical protein
MRDQTALRIVGIQLCGTPECFSRLLQRREMVGAVVEEVARFLGRQQQTARARFA